MTNGNAITWNQLDLHRMSVFANRLAGVLADRSETTAVGLVGTLGAGKTQLTTLIARSIGVASDDVTSPTFTLAQHYRGSIGGDAPVTVDLHHVDAYRIADEDEWFEAGMEELLDTSASQDHRVWIFVEWADRFADWMPDDTLWIRIDWDTQSASPGDLPTDLPGENDQPRRITITGNKLPAGLADDESAS
ncbi:tRNA (adenosine(37)-N6)-threonylcarbamoyltransferase complex ATPase subunit type 1 TsaE [Crateriforma conspicua]|uniref:tRNA (adenosine(37)-N6)-threonylcarbamoyltransferase complex ATPase subunit type 1 TsaE n=1 Tax=Crateriforma conspicua TaxID=2527996 RepID=UPI00118BC3C7|nr:tRNA (adenosine(37)-N6)-threonylcarbamoyltransferase complex ATPase subunit type 1 TsaE [Crateriforma conspicua]QDV63898.1 tRNA threonylcarbamoyladenosine biosynthesis protein TsaE [Crateriforma conspicua]